MKDHKWYYFWFICHTRNWRSHHCIVGCNIP